MQDLRQQPLLLDPAHHVRAQLVPGVVGPPRRLPEADIARGDGDDGVPVRVRERDVRVVAGAVDVQVVRLGHGRGGGGGGEAGGSDGRAGAFLDVLEDGVEGGAEGGFAGGVAAAAAAVAVAAAGEGVAVLRGADGGEDGLAGRWSLLLLLFLWLGGRGAGGVGDWDWRFGGSLGGG